MENFGIENELEIIQAIDHKKYGELSKHWQKVLTIAFGKTKPNEVIYAMKGHLGEKADIYVRMNHLTRSFSIKSGRNVSVHTEKLSTFASFLKWCGVEEKYLNTLKLFHYGDDTTNGMGEVRRKISDLLQLYNNEIK